MHTSYSQMLTHLLSTAKPVPLGLITGAPPRIMDGDFVLERSIPLLAGDRMIPASLRKVLANLVTVLYETKCPDNQTSRLETKEKAECPQNTLLSLSLTMIRP